MEMCTATFEESLCGNCSDCDSKNCIFHPDFDFDTALAKAVEWTRDWDNEDEEFDEV